MKIITKLSGLRKEIKQAKRKNRTIGFVPTMGALHKGHLSLIRKARRQNDIVIVSIFVNPIQFGPKEDYASYPRNLKLDAQLCGKEKTDIIFYPDAKEMYPPNYKTYVTVEHLGDVLCGRSRLGHFKGVATVVTKLLNIVNPDIAYFGQKDAQQAIIIKKLVCDLNMPVKIKIMPTVRESNGLALSSRNVYLNSTERKDALVLYQALQLAKDLIRRGVRDAGKITSQMKHLIKKKETAKIDYVSIVNLENLEPVKKITKNCLIAVAVWIGRTRLIDNIIISH
jgi:pantoate--beta-alanine ligase